MSKCNLASVICDMSSVFDVVIHTRSAPTVARTGHTSSAVQDMLDRKVDINTLSTTRDFDAISEGTEGSVRPTRTAVLRYMLI